MMRRSILSFLFSIAVLLGAAPALRAQYYSINIDLKTAAAMQAAYSAGAAGEALFETSKHIGVIEPGSIYDDILKEHIYLEEIR